MQPSSSSPPGVSAASSKRRRANKTGAANTPAVLVQLQNIHKSFGSVQVLHGVDFTLRAGEIHALMGENGAGKSTLMKILCGIYRADTGSIHVRGQAADIRNTRDAQALGIAIIHQELNLIRQLSVAENLFLGREPRRFGLLDRHAMREQSRYWLRQIGAEHIDPDAEAGHLSIGQQQMVEIARALSLDAHVLVMDEPTAALTQRETEHLFTMMCTLKQRGVGIIYVSHRMEEIFSICDSISVLRDGCFVGQRRIADTDFDEVVSLMVGRDIGQRFPTRHSSTGQPRLCVEGLCDRTGRITDISFTVHAGEVLGIAGLMGAGRSEILQTIFGMRPIQSGHITLDGQPLRVRRPIDAIRAGIGFVTEDRKHQGLVLGLSVRENMTLTRLPHYTRAGVLRHRSQAAAVAHHISRLKVRTRDAELEVRALSGGNQQKVVFAKWLEIAPRVLLLDEPTRGVDIGGKAEIYHIINELAAQGIAIVMVSSELPEVLAISDRILVMHQGLQNGIFDAANTTQEAIMAAATGTTSS